MKSQYYKKFNTKGVEIEEVLTELKRTFSEREKEYPKLILEGKMTKHEANRRLLGVLKAMQLLFEERDGVAEEVEIRQGNLFK